MGKGGFDIENFKTVTEKKLCQLNILPHWYCWEKKLKNIEKGPKTLSKQLNVMFKFKDGGHWSPYSKCRTSVTLEPWISLPVFRM